MRSRLGVARENPRLSLAYVAELGRIGSGPPKISPSPGLVLERRSDVRVLALPCPGWCSNACRPCLLGRPEAQSTAQRAIRAHFEAVSTNSRRTRPILERLRPFLGESDLFRAVLAGAQTELANRDLSFWAPAQMPPWEICVGVVGTSRVPVVRARVCHDRARNRPKSLQNGPCRASSGANSVGVAIILLAKRRRPQRPTRSCCAASIYARVEWPSCALQSASRPVLVAGSTTRGF